jgi:hypothetical protein
MSNTVPCIHPTGHRGGGADHLASKERLWNLATAYETATFAHETNHPTSNFHHIFTGWLRKGGYLKRGAFFTLTRK